MEPGCVVGVPRPDFASHARCPSLEIAAPMIRDSSWDAGRSPGRQRQATTHAPNVTPTTMANQPCGENGPVPALTANGPAKPISATGTAIHAVQTGSTWCLNVATATIAIQALNPKPAMLYGQPAGVPKCPRQSGIGGRAVRDDHEQRRAGAEDPSACDHARQRGRREPFVLALGAPDDAVQTGGEDHDYGQPHGEQQVAREQLIAVDGCPLGRSQRPSIQSQAHAPG